MILRSLILLGVGAAIVCAAPALAAGTTPASSTETAAAAPATTATATTGSSQPQMAALETGTPKADAPPVKKPKAVAKKTTKKKKVVAKAKPVEEPKPEKSRGLFAALFGGGIKDAGDDDAKKKADASKAKTKVAKAAAKPTKVVAPEPVEEAEVLPAITGNDGELRSENPKQKPSLLASLFGGGSQSMTLLPETRALDAALERKQAKKPFKVKPEYIPQEVDFDGGYPAGTIVIDTNARRLYLVESSSTARRYAIAVGREGLQFKGTVAVGDKQEWPRWIPTLDMQKREPKHYGQYKDGMPGGGENPLGARAIYLYDGKKDTHLRIHGTIAPQSIGTSASNGCFRMINDHVMDLYRRVKMGTQVVIL